MLLSISVCRLEDGVCSLVSQYVSLDGVLLLEWRYISFNPIHLRGEIR